MSEHDAQKARYVTTVTGDTEIRHLNGVPWHDAPKPRRRHKCWPQTEGWIRVTQVWRCACGAICHPSPTGRHVWLERNSR